MPKNSSDFVWIAESLRTPIGSSFKSLSTFSAAQLGGIVIKELLSKNKIKKDLIGEVIFGNTVSAGAGQNIARQAAILGGLSVSVPAYSVNSVCGSGLQSIISATQAILSGDADCLIAGGAESSSQCPFIVRKNDKGQQGHDHYLDSLIHDGLLCQIIGKHMGELAESLAEQYKITREEQDQYSFESHQKAGRAQEEKKFKDEIISVCVREGQTCSGDERPRSNISVELLKNLPAAFIKGGTVTAGNSSIPSDGAAAVLLASSVALKKNKIKPQARILGYASVAVEPQLVFTAAIPAIKECLKKCKLALKDVDLFEISEAFAVQALFTQRELKIPSEKINIFGGDIALGHPLGAAGTRILVTLIHALQNQKKKRGLACVCLGGGGAVAVALEVV